MSAIDPRPVLLARGVSKSFGEIRALDGVDLSVAPGELVVLLGLNGAGKSTLLQLLTGLFTPDSGTIVVCGHDLRTNVVAGLRNIGVVFQQPTVDLELSVSANLWFHAELHGLPHRVARERIAESLRRFGLEDRAKAAVRTLSGGNRRRVELARALLHAPRALVMDEATVGLDPASRRDILGHIATIRSEGQVGVLWTTHLVDEAQPADRVVVLRRGRVLFDGAPGGLAGRHPSGDLGEAFLGLNAGEEAQPVA